MTDKKKDAGVLSAKDVATATAAAGAAATSALVMSPGATPTVAAVAAALVALFPPILAAMTEVGVRRMKTRADRFFSAIVDDWARSDGKTPEEIAGLLEAAKEDLNVADAIWRTVRGLMDAPNDEAAVPLGVLAAEYVRERRAADAFFRGTVRLLQELETRELDELRNLLGWMVDVTKRDRVDLVARRGAIDAALDEFVDVVGVDGMPDKRASTKVASDADRLFSLLTANGLAVSHPGMRLDAGLPEITVSRLTAERLHRLLAAR